MPQLVSEIAGLEFLIFSTRPSRVNPEYFCGTSSCSPQGEHHIIDNVLVRDGEVINAEIRISASREFRGLLNELSCGDGKARKCHGAQTVGSKGIRRVCGALVWLDV